jgi:hypothetical protein
MRFQQHPQTQFRIAANLSKLQGKEGGFMTKSPSEPRYVKIVNGPTQPSGSGVGYVVVGILSIFLLATNTYGFSKAFRLPALFGLVLAVVTLMVKLHMLRPRPAHERASSSGLDRAMFYLVPAFLSTLFSAFGIYCLALAEGDTMETQQARREKLASAIGAIGNYYQTVRAEILVRFELNADRLRDLKQAPPSPPGQQEVNEMEEERQAPSRESAQEADARQETDKLEEEQQALNWLYERVMAALKSNASDQVDGDDSPAGVGSKDWNSTESAIQKKLGEAARLHSLLPPHIRKLTPAPLVESPLDERVPVRTPGTFFRDMLDLTSEVIGCWAAPAILELFTVIILLGNRPRD